MKICFAIIAGLMLSLSASAEHSAGSNRARSPRGDENLFRSSPKRNGEAKLAITYTKRVNTPKGFVYEKVKEDTLETKDVDCSVFDFFGTAMVVVVEDEENRQLVFSTDIPKITFVLHKDLPGQITYLDPLEKDVSVSRDGHDLEMSFTIRNMVGWQSNGLGDPDKVGYIDIKGTLSCKIENRTGKPIEELFKKRTAPPVLK